MIPIEIVVKKVYLNMNAGICRNKNAIFDSKYRHMTDGIL